MAGSVCINMDFAALPGAIMEEKLAHAQKNVPVLVFGKEHCSFTLEVRRTFDSLSVPFTLYNVDVIPDGAKVHNLLKESTKQATVPYVYIGGDLIGGCDATKAAQHNGTLAKKLAAVGIYPKGLSGAKPIEFALPEDSRRPLTTLVAFPEVVDERVARFAGVWAFIVCLLVAVFWWTPQAKWTMCGLMVDFVLRFLGGGNISPLGALSTLCVGVMEWFGSKPRWVSGQAKQFATLCGIMFSTLAFFFYIVSIHEDKLDKVGLAFTCALGVATGLEGFVGFCLGCWMFGLMIRFGVLPEDTYRVYTNVVDEAAATWEDMNKRLNEGEPAKHRRLIRSDGIPSDIDYKYKAKTDDMTKEDFHIIKHVKITHFYMHMGITGLACAWKAASPYASLYAPTAVEYAVALLAAVLFVAFLFLYAMKMIKYPHKVAKEWQCPVRGNAFAVPFIVSMLFAYIVDQHSHRFGMVLFWIGAPITMALGIKRMANWISRRVDFEHINASWMVAPVGNAVAALVGPYIEVGHTNACQFWWAVAFISWTLLFTITFYKHVINVDEDDRMRPLVAIWVAAPAVLAVSYLQVYPVIVVSGEIFNDFIFINLHWIAVGIALCLVYTFSPMAGAFSGRMRFDMAYWAAGFPAAALSLCTTTYNLVKPGNLSYGIAIAGLATATVVNLVLCINTLSALVRRRVFVPDAKWGPLSFMRLTHEALRGAIDNMLKLAELMSSSQTVSPDLVADVNESWKMMALVHDEHSKHEDQVIFKLYDEFFPGIAKDWNDQHNHHHEIMKNIDEILVTLTKNPSCEAAKQLESALQEYAKELELHLRGEEDHLIGLPRKFINLNLHKQTIRKVWDITAVPNWFKILPWVVNNLPYLHQRVRFLKTIIWALPERSQHIGMMVGLGVDAVQWRRVTDELPDIIPRGAPGPYKRYY